MELQLLGGVPLQNLIFIYTYTFQHCHTINHCNEIIFHNKFLLIQKEYAYIEKVGNIWIIIATWNLAKYIVSLKTIEYANFIKLGNCSNTVTIEL